MQQMTDFGPLMGLDDLGPEQEPLGVDEYAMALDLREGGDSENQHMQPELHQDYAGVNPYAEGAHGGWMDNRMVDMMDGMGMFAGEADGAADAGLGLPLGGEDDDEDDDLLDEQIELDADSAEYQGLVGEEDEDDEDDEEEY